MFRKILVPLDGSMLAEKALPYAVRLANRLDAQLYLVRSVEVPSLLENKHQVEQELVLDAEAYLNRVTRWISSRTLKPHTDPLRIHTNVFRGDPVKEITYFVKNCEIDLVLLSTHGRGGLSRLVIGSVAAKIQHQVDVPVMLFRPFENKHDQVLAETFSGVGEPYSNRFQGQGGRVVLTLDGSALSEAALEPACELALKLQAELHLLKINQESAPVTYGNLPGLGFFNTRIHQDEEEDEMASTLYLAKIAGSLAEKNAIMLVTEVRTGDIAEQITAYACEIEADAIVMATHAPGEFGWFITGSIAERVMRQSHLPVMMLPVHELAAAGTGQGNNRPVLPRAS
ncbi:MAG: hypothetical protein JWP00_5013 [Chloroflexi bacterium]|jgi:nucleotide-binding universal stress UspA family protein|nr:hypothetical protein [Chloroflexota bacterium]